MAEDINILNVWADEGTLFSWLSWLGGAERPYSRGLSTIYLKLYYRPPAGGGQESGIVPVGQQHPSLEGKQLPRFR